MKKLVYLYCIILLTSCSIAIDPNKEGLIIKEFRSDGDKCQYSGYINGSWVHINDSCGKYKVGDTLYLGKKH